MKKCPSCGAKMHFGETECSACSYVIPPRKPISKLCLAGFITAVLPALCVAIDFIVKEDIVRIVLTITSIVFLVTGLVISVIGMFKDQDKRIGFGIAGASISAVFMAPFVLYLFIANTLYQSNKEYEERTYNKSGNVVYKSFYGPESEGSNFLVRRTDVADDNSCMAIYWYWNGDPGKNKINIPFYLDTDTQSGLHPTSLGGNELHPDGFCIVVKPEEKDFFSTPEYLNSPKKGDIYSEPEAFGVAPGTEVHYENIVFTVVIHRDIWHVSMGLGKGEQGILAVINDDESITFYHYTFYFECNSDNPVYYSENGILYKKKDGSRVSF